MSRLDRTRFSTAASLTVTCLMVVCLVTQLLAFPQGALASPMPGSTSPADTAMADSPPAAKPLPVDTHTFGALRARSIGPATMSGRIAALDGVSADPATNRPMTLWAGAASGGVWKSDDGGTRFEPVFDDHPQSIGALRIDPSDPDTVWVGTGESWVRNSVSVGAGVFKTTDGGETWTLMGLENSERIAAIRIDPTDGNTVYVCALGHLWNSHDERGVYKTTDGGETWERILYVDVDTGCADLDLDPQNPDILYAAMWQFRREPDFFTSGGPGSGLHKSTDGGATWTRLTEGLPEGELGRIAVAVAPSRPSVVYATVESADTALYRSDDLGQTWTRTNASPNVVMRPFYFSELVVDPVDYRRVYKPGFTLTTSVDGGESFTSMFASFGGGIHPDHHALWIDPENPQNLALGTDGGVYLSQNRTQTWSFVRTLPVSQFYQVSYDLETPYNVYGGLQDNGTWTGPSQSPGGVQVSDWENIGFGDGFWAFPHPEDVDIVFVEYQGGRLMRIDRRQGELKHIAPYPKDGEEELRFNWNTPIHLSPNDPKTLYYGSQHLHRSTDNGESWETLSPDLTTDDPQKQRQKSSGGLTIDNSTAENHCTIYTIAESPVDPNVLWVGTDDGLVQLSRDGGATWTELSGNVPGLPPNTWVSRIDASPHDAGTAFATFDGHRTGDMTTYVYVTHDHGATWRSLATDTLDGYAHVIEQDTVNPNLLFLGTEHGLFISLDQGIGWARFEEDLPPVSVQDLSVHPREHDLIVGTHGRGIYIIDDITPIRHLTAEVLDADVSLLPSKPSVMRPESPIQQFSADDEFVGGNPPLAATITYHLKKRHLFGDLRVEIYNADGELLRTLPAGKRRGLNRVDWPMRLKPPKMPAATSLVPAFTGPRVPEGTYTVKLIKGKKTLEDTFEVRVDAEGHSRDDRILQQTTALELYDALGDMTFAMDRLTGLRDDARARAETLRQAKGRRGDIAELESFADALEAQRGSLVSTSSSGMLSGDDKLRERLGNLFGDINTYDGRPTDSQLAEKDRLLAEFDTALGSLDQSIDDTLPTINRLLERRGQAPLEPLTREAWDAENADGGSAQGTMVLSKAQRRYLVGWTGTGPMVRW